MRLVACHSCRTLVQVGGDLEEVKSLLAGQDSFPCITALCQGRLQTIRSATGSVLGYQTREVPIRGFFRAIHGFGTGSGDPASAAHLRELLLSKKIVDMVISPVGQPERVIVREIILEDGTRLHFEASARGACVYYIEERGPSCTEVVEDEIATELAAESGDSDREEAGRAAEVDASSSPETIGVPGASDVPTAEQPESGGVPGVSTADHVPGAR